MSNNLRKLEVKASIGVFTVIGSATDLSRILFPDDDLSEVAAIPLVKAEDGFIVLQEAGDTLERYFKGEPVSWAGKSLPEGSKFMRRVWELTAEIPFGRTVSYGELAARAGSPGAARAVGSAMARNPVPILVPCHRVIGSDGGLCGFGGGLDLKRQLLEHEGISIP